MNGEPEERSLTTADFAAAAEMPTVQREFNQAIQEPVIENQKPRCHGWRFAPRYTLFTGCGQRVSFALGCRSKKFCR